MITEFNLIDLIEEHDKYRALIERYNDAKNKGTDGLSKKIMSIAREHLAKIEHQINLYYFENQETTSSLLNEVHNKKDISKYLKPHLNVDNNLLSSMFFNHYFKEIDYFFEYQPYNQATFLTQILQNFNHYSETETMTFFSQKLTSECLDYVCQKIPLNLVDISVFFELFSCVLDKQYKHCVCTQGVLDVLFKHFTAYFGGDRNNTIAQMRQFIQTVQYNKLFYYEWEKTEQYFDQYLLKEDLEIKLSRGCVDLKVIKI